MTKVVLRRPTRGEALADQTYVSLRDAIVTHELPPGTRLSVPEIARRLGISRSPVREAIARITYEGLAHIGSNRSAVVSEIRIADLIEIYTLREVLEGLACWLAAERHEQDDVKRLRTIFDRHERAVAAGDPESHYELDQEFHATIRMITQHHRLVESLDRLQAQIRVAMYATHRSPGGMPQALSEHRIILDALVARDPARAEQAGRAHISRLLRDLRRNRDEGDGNDGNEY